MEARAGQRHLLWVPKEIARGLPALYLEDLVATATYISVEADGVAQHARVDHPDDDPRGALQHFVKHASEFQKLLVEKVRELQDHMDSAFQLLKEPAFAEKKEDE